MSQEEFDMQAAVATIGGDLFGGSDDVGGGDDTPELDVKLPVTDTPATEVTEIPATTEVETAPAATAVTPPKTWRKEALAEWDKLSPTVQAEVAKREEDMFRGLEGYRADATFGKSVNQALAPFIPILQQYNIDPIAQISGLMQAHHTLALGTPEAKTALFQKLAHDYGVQIGAPVESEGFVDPQVKSLIDRVEALQSKLSRYETTQHATEVEKAQGEITSFMSDPANVYAKDLVNDMSRLLTKGEAKDLKDAYEKAMWLNPEVREKEVTRRNNEAQTQTRAKAQEAAAKAKAAAAANLRTTAKDASSTAPLGTMDDTLSKAYADIMKRG
jgi:hypothetical protein